MNLLETLKNHATPDLIGKAAAILGESEPGVSKAVGGILPTVLGGLLGKSATTGGASELMDMFSSGAYDGNIPDDVSGLLDGATAAADTGGGLPGSLFGDKIAGISNLISSFSGIKGSSVSSLLAMAAPLVMGVVGRQVASQGLGATGLQSLLMSQKDSIAAALPAGIGSMLGLGSLPDMGGQTAGDVGGTAASTRPAATDYVQDENQNSNWWLWLLLLAGLVFGVFYFLRGCNNEPETGAVAVTDTVAATPMDTMTVAEKILSVTGEDLGGMIAKTFADGTEIRIPERGVESRLLAFIEDSSRVVDKTTWFDFDRLLFDTGKATLKFDSSGTEEQLANVVAILKAHPQAGLKIGGYTDNTGDAQANMKLSGDRAKTVMAELVTRGIAANRLAAEGYGDQYAVAGNDTEQGRAKNRRVSLRVTRK